MKQEFMTPEQLRRAGIAALTQALGPIEATRFLQLFDPGGGDYTAERAGLLGKPSVDELAEELRRQSERR